MKCKSRVMFGMICLSLLVSMPVFAEDKVVFEDTMNTLNNWSKGALMTADDTVDHAPYMKLGNAVTYTKLPQQLTGDWTLEVAMRHTNFSRGLWVGLFDDAMQRGYAALWDSSLEKYFHGNGMFVICDIKSKEADKPVGFQADLTRIGKPVEGPQLIKDPKFAHVKLTFEAATGKLMLSVNDKLLQTVTQTDLKTFDRLVIRGNTDGLFDNIKVSQPTP